MLIDTAAQLSTATILEIGEHVVRLRLEEGGEVPARMALGYPYRPNAGDVVVAIGQGERHFVIGVLRGTGKTVLTAPGDLDLEAPNGRITLVSSEEIRATAPEVTLRANRMQFIAKTLLEKFGNAYRWVQELFETRSGRVRTVAESTIHVKGERIVQRAEKDVKIDGAHIRLG